MARIMLINPPWYVFLGMSSSSVPLGLISLAGSLMKSGHEVSIFNPDLYGNIYASDLDILEAKQGYLDRLANKCDPVWQAIGKRVKEWQPGFIGVHVKTPSWESGCMVARISKDFLPTAITVCGGPHVSCAPETIKPGSGFDYGVCGEGEIPLSQLVNVSTEEREHIPGVINLKKKALAPNCTLPLVSDLDLIPYDGRRALLDIEKYDKMNIGAIMTSRGCPFPCQYCASKKTWTMKVRYRSPDNVIEEIDHLVNNYGVTNFHFADDTFTVNKKRAHSICDLLLAYDADFKWKCTTRADCIDQELAKKMKASGCIGASIGVESGSPRILEFIEKAETKEDIAKGCRIFRECGIPFFAFIMIGFPHETVAEAWETFNFSKSLGADSLCGSIVTPYPGTELYTWAQKAGKLPEGEKWSQYYHQNSGMGLWDVPDEEAKKVIAEWFKKIEQYNHRPSRLLKRFMGTFRADPSGTIKKSTSLLKKQFKKIKHSA